MMIARTETAGAVTQGRFDGFKAAGVGYKSWLSARSGEVRQAHKDADSKYATHPIPMNEPFVVGGEKMMHPGDRAASAGNVINCRCCLLPVTSKKAAVEQYATVEFMGISTWQQKAIKEELNHVGKD